MNPPSLLLHLPSSCALREGAAPATPSYFHPPGLHGGIAALVAPRAANCGCDYSHPRYILQCLPPPALAPALSSIFPKFFPKLCVRHPRLQHKQPQDSRGSVSHSWVECLSLMSFHLSRDGFSPPAPSCWQAADQSWVSSQARGS